MYERVLVPVKTAVRQRQLSRRLARSAAAFGTDTGLDVEAVSAVLIDIGHRYRAGEAIVVPKRAITLSVEEQVALIESCGVSHIAFNRLRLGFGGSDIGMSSIPALRASRQSLASRHSKRSRVDGTGAHLENLTAAVQELINRLLASGLFRVRSCYDSDVIPVPQTQVHLPRSSPFVWQRAAVHDVKIGLGIDKGGNRSSCKLLLACMNQE